MAVSWDNGDSMGYKTIMNKLLIYHLVAKLSVASQGPPFKRQNCIRRDTHSSEPLPPKQWIVNLWDVRENHPSAEAVDLRDLEWKYKNTSSIEAIQPCQYSIPRLHTTGPFTRLLWMLHFSLAFNQMKREAAGAMISNRRTDFFCQ